jgi:hypothetical protein
MATFLMEARLPRIPDKYHLLRRAAHRPKPIFYLNKTCWVERNTVLQEMVPEQEHEFGSKLLSNGTLIYHIAGEATKMKTKRLFH